MKHATTARRIAPPAANHVAIVPPANDQPRPLRKARRTLKQVLEELPTEIDEVAYALQRINGREIQIAKILELCGPKALQHILQARPDLKRYVVLTN